MEPKANSQRSDTSMVDLGLQPLSSDVSTADASRSEPLRRDSSQSDGARILEADASSQENPNQVLGDGEEEKEKQEEAQWKNGTSSDSDRGDAEVQDSWMAESSAMESSAVESSAMEFSAGESLARESSAAFESGGVFLLDGVNLQGETDVDVAESSDRADLAGRACRLDDLSFSTGKLSSAGSESVPGGAFGNAMTSSLSQHSGKTMSESETCQTESDTSERSRSAPEASMSSSSFSGGDQTVGERTKSWDADSAAKGGAEKTDAVSDSACTAEGSAVSQKVLVPRNVSSDHACASGDMSDHAPQNLTVHEDGEMESNNIASHEPFSTWVDVSRLRADLGEHELRGEQSGNTQEQELRSLVQRKGDVQSRKQLKKLLRSGSWAPASTVRKVAWHLVCDYLYKLEKAYVFVQMEKEMFGDVEGDDIPVPTWPQQSSHEEPLLTEYYLQVEGKNTAHKIVSVIAQLSPHITYSPGLLPVVDLFLHYMDAADCFSCVLTLLESNSPVYFTQSRVAFEASKHVLRDLAKKYTKSAYVALVRSGVNVDTVFDGWMSWIYCDLPFNYVVAVTDSYLMEGMKVLYRVVLAIIILFTKHAGNGMRGTGNAGHSIAEFCRHLPIPPAKLLKVAFRIRGFSRRKILKLQHRHESNITSGAAGHRPDMPHVASALSMGELSTAMSMVHPNTKIMGFHDVGSNILTVDQLVTIWSWLPTRHTIYQPKLLFNSADQGTSLTTLYAHIEYEPCTIIVIKTIEGEVFGAFCAESWAERRNHSRPIGFFGTGETFLFTLVPERNKFEWVGVPNPHVPLSANMFQAGDQSSLLIGGGNGSGIQIDGAMERCRTETCDTFNNPPLCPSMDFVPASVEVFGLQ